MSYSDVTLKNTQTVVIPKGYENAKPVFLRESDVVFPGTSAGRKLEELEVYEALPHVLASNERFQAKAKGAQIRAKVDLIYTSEKSNKYFLNLEKDRQN